MAGGQDGRCLSSPLGEKMPEGQMRGAARGGLRLWLPLIASLRSALLPEGRRGSLRQHHSFTN